MYIYTIRNTLKAYPTSLVSPEKFILKHLIHKDTGQMILQQEILLSATRANDKRLAVSRQTDPIPPEWVELACTCVIQLITNLERKI